MRALRQSASDPAERPLRVCYFGTYRTSYSRNRIMLEGLRQNGVVVYECHETLWQGIEDRVQAVSGGWKRPAFWWRLVRAYARLVWRYWSVPDHDVLVVGYPGQPDVFPARLLSWLRGKPLVWDVFMSIYLIAQERDLGRRSALGMRLLRWLEWAACRLPDRLIIDTEDYAAWFQTTHGISAERFGLVPTGADDRLYRPMAVPARDDGQFVVVYYGSFIPNHGVLSIVEAAHLLTDELAVRFELIGTGPERPAAQALADSYGLKNIVFCDWLEPEALVQRVARADVCLGAFGLTPQSLMTVQNKIYEGLAMGKPVITGDSPAVRRVLKHGEHIYLCERANPVALAEAVRELYADGALCLRLAHNGLAYYQQHFTVACIGWQLSRCLPTRSAAVG